MESLAPVYLFVQSLIQDLESGIVLRTSIEKYIKTQNNNFSEELCDWYSEKCYGGKKLNRAKLTSFRSALFDLLDFSLQGASVLSSLQELEKEMRFASELTLDIHLSKLPYKLMVPLLLFQFPAFLILLLGPLLMQLMDEVN